jgi:hypothetical protein
MLHNYDHQYLINHSMPSTTLAFTASKSGQPVTCLKMKLPVPFATHVAFNYITPIISQSMNPPYNPPEIIHHSIIHSIHSTLHLAVHFVSLPSQDGNLAHQRMHLNDQHLSITCVNDQFNSLAISPKICS